MLVRHPAIDPVTVYRTLESLEAHGLAVKMELGDRVTRAHHHLICRRCKAIVELDHDPFERLANDLAASAGVHVDLQHLVVHGLCAACVSGSNG